jgi:nitrogen fixation NifU-like protein
LYQDTLLDHHRKPRHFGELGGTPTVERENPLCGDVVRLAIDLTDNAICDLRFDGHGCALCIASASLMCCALRDKDTGAARALAANLMSALLPYHRPRLSHAAQVRNAALDRRRRALEKIAGSGNADVITATPPARNQSRETGTGPFTGRRNAAGLPALSAKPPPATGKSCLRFRSSHGP